jgi:ABC-type glycerol-3-phosphate transport system substrate-binding protein
MSMTRVLILSAVLGLAACSGTTTEPSGGSSQVTLPGDPPQGHCLPNGGGCVNPHQ